MLARRAQTFYEKHFTDMRMDTEFGIELVRKALVPEFIERMQRCFLGARVKLEGGNLVSLREPSPVIKLPECSDLEEACTWLAHNAHPFETSIGSIAANDRFVVVTANHMMGDGGCYVRMLEMLQDPRKIPAFEPLPESVEVTFAEQIEKLDRSRHYHDGRELTVVQSPGQLPKPDVDVFARVKSFRMPVSEISCYDKSSGKCVRLNERMWVSVILALSALRGEMGRFGICVPVDMRRYLPSIGMRHCNTFSVVWTHAPVIPDQRIEDLEKALRKELDARMVRGDLFAYHDRRIARLPHLPGARSEVSHLARLAFKDPLKDVWAQLTARNFNNDTVSLLAFSAYNEDTGLNEFRGRVRLPQSYFTAEDTTAVIDAVEFGIRHIKSQMSVRDAFEMLRKKMWA